MAYDKNQNIDRELNWDDTITEDSKEFVLLPDGDYEFVVTEVERQRYNGGPKLPPCNQAVIHILIDTPLGVAKVKNNLYLHTKTEGLVSAFFGSIGQKKKGEPLRMNWAKVIGSKGLCKISQYQGNDGNTYNEVKRFLPSEDRQESSGWQPGKF